MGLEIGEKFELKNDSPYSSLLQQNFPLGPKLNQSSPFDGYL